ncbi:MAG: hypothetical protein J6Q41_00725 [Firmicutes bacterium]|nr:hypothetical protein [Bacillota bacterium]
MKLDFTLAKKFSRNNVKGLELRSAEVERAVVFNTSGKGYEKVRETYDEFRKASEVSGKEPDLKLKGIGKSYEISGKDTMEFLGHLTFVNESHNDFVDFYNTKIKDIGSVLELDLDERAALVQMTAEGDSFEDFFEELLPIIEKYDIGIFKK